jgi:branched-chain amino acid transport system substrate-binding protein
MTKRGWFAVVTLLAALSLVAAGCADDEGGGGGGGGGGGVDCSTVEFGCVEVGPDDPINIGASQVISGADATLGQDQVNGIELALDHRDGAFDGTDGMVLGHAS